MRRNLTRFKNEYLQTKEEILFSLSEYKKHIENNEEKFSKQKVNSIIEVIDKMITKVNNSELPQLDNWWYYEYRFTQFEFILDMSCCEEVKYDIYGEPDGLTTSQVYSLIKIPATLFTIEEYAERFFVTNTTVKKWLKEGKLRAAKKIDNKWFISGFAERPKRKYEPVLYIWVSIENNLYKEFPYLESYNCIYICKLEKDKFKIILGYPGSDNRKSIEINNNEREKLEYILLSLQDVVAEDSFTSIMFVPGKEMDSQLKTLLNYDNISNINDEFLEYGEVLIKGGKYKGKIGCYDDDAGPKAIVYFGDPLLTDNYDTIKHRYLTNIVPTIALVKNMNELFHKIAESISIYDKYNYLQELNYCSNLLNNRYLEAMNKVMNDKNTQIFISYSRQDETYAKGLATDLIHEGYTVFLDQWSIDLGENIMARISDGIKRSDVLIMIISTNYLNSIFCSEEWTSFYMKFSRNKNNIIYPIILDESDPPDILAARKYLRISPEKGYDYFDCLRDLLKALKKHFNNDI